MSVTEIRTGKTIYDLARAFQIGVSDARFLFTLAPYCFLVEYSEIMLPPIYGRWELTA